MKKIQNMKTPRDKTTKEITNSKTDVQYMEEGKNKTGNELNTLF